MKNAKVQSSRHLYYFGTKTHPIKILVTYYYCLQPISSCYYFLQPDQQQQQLLNNNSMKHRQPCNFSLAFVSKQTSHSLIRWGLNEFSNIYKRKINAALVINRHIITKQQNHGRQFTAYMNIRHSLSSISSQDGSLKRMIP